MRARKSCHEASHEFLIIADCEFSMNVYGLVIPCRYLPVELMLAGIPVRGDVGACSAKNDKNLLTILCLLPDGICTSNVCKQVPSRATGRIQVKGQMIRIQSSRPIDHKSSKWMLIDYAMELFNPRLFKMLR